MYSAGDRRWHQSCVDSQGSLLELADGLKGGRMVLAGDTPQPNRKVVTNRVIWEKPDHGRVHQHWATSADIGMTWSDAIVGLYSRNPQAGGNR